MKFIILYLKEDPSRQRPYSSQRIVHQNSTYNEIGVAAPISLVILRMIQGMNFGGQIAGNYVMSIEKTMEKNRGFRGAVCNASLVDF